MLSLSKTATGRYSDARPADTGMIRRSGPLLLRLIVGYGFMFHGYAKWSRGPETFAVVLHTIGVPLPSLFAWLTTLVELIGGFAIFVGAFVPIVSLPMAAVLLTALFTIHLPYGFSSVKLADVSASGVKFGPVGYEVILIYLASLAAIALGGAGALSIDEWRARRGESMARRGIPRDSADLASRGGRA